MAVPSLELAVKELVVVQLGDTVDAQREVRSGAQDGLLEGSVNDGLAGVVDPVAVGVQTEGGGHMTVSVDLIGTVSGGLAGGSAASVWRYLSFF